MSLILDAYNVLHCTHVLPERWSDIGATGLCKMIDKAGVKLGRAYVVCDGSPPPQVIQFMARSQATYGAFLYRIGSVELIYAGGGKDADSLIEVMVEEEKAPRELTVVSNDRRVQRAARSRGATPMESEAFLRRLADALRVTGPSPDAKPTSEPHADEWIRKFGLEGPRTDAGEIESETNRWLREFGFDDS